MRIAYFNANMRVGQDGVTRVMYRTMEEAQRRGHHVMALTATLPDPGTTDIPMFRVPSVTLPLQKAYRIALPGYQHFSDALRDFRPDLLHINSPCTLGFAAMKYAQRHETPIVATYHTHFPTYPRYYNLEKFEELAWKLTRHLYNHVDRTFVPTSPILDELRQNGIAGVEYLPNGVDLQLFNPDRRSATWRAAIGAQQKTAILFVSRLVWEKNLRVLADAYRLLSSTRDDFVMAVVGDGHARAELEALMPGAKFLGYQSGADLAQSYASADIFAFPSTTETFGLVTLEAMASGIAPVAAKYGGAVHIIQEGRSGLFSTPEDPADLALQLERLLDNPAEREALRAGALVRAQEFGWGAVFDQLFQSYEDVARRRFRNAA